MTEENKLIELRVRPPADRMCESVLSWLTRTYKSSERWKAHAKKVFFDSNGDSDLSRIRLAGVVRSYFLQGTLRDEEVRLWKTGFEEVGVADVEPPNVSASCSAYVDWIYVADYLLLSCATPTEQMIDENQRRESEFQSMLSSFNIRSIVHAARQEMRDAPE